MTTFVQGIFASKVQRMPRACPMEIHDLRYFSWEREPPRDKPVASKRNLLAGRVGDIVNLHGTSPWHPSGIF